jgi:protein-arginine kinase activator protein McsA
MKRLTAIEFIERAKSIPGNRYDYSKSIYVNGRTRMEILCPTHGSFWQTADDHLQSRGCKACGYEKNGKTSRFTQQEFLQKCKETHGDRYNYSHVKYTECYEKVQIGCLKHGWFWQSPVAHIHQKQGCPKCSRSRGELIIEDWLETQKIVYVCQMKFEGLTNGKRGWGLRYDFYLPDYNTLIEVDGIGHYKTGVGRWFGKHQITVDDYNRNRKNDETKTLYASRNNMRLLRIPYKNRKDTQNIIPILEKEI